VCGAEWGSDSWDRLAAHLVEQADASEDRHVMWLNRTVTKYRTDAEELVPLLRAAFEAGGTSAGMRVRR
jgi:hypothetical protein